MEKTVFLPTCSKNMRKIKSYLGHQNFVFKKEREIISPN